MADINIVLDELKNKISELIIENAVLNAEVKESKEKIESLEALLTELKATDK